MQLHPMLGVGALLARGSDQKAIREQLVRILNSGPFHQSQRRQRFLEYLVNETLAGRSERLKAYNVALEVFERPETFDPITDPDAKGLLHGSRVPFDDLGADQSLGYLADGVAEDIITTLCSLA